MNRSVDIHLDRLHIEVDRLQPVGLSTHPVKFIALLN